MAMSPKVRRFAAVAHVVSSVGWLGAVAAFLALAMTGLTTGSILTARSAYLAADTVTDAVILPFAFASLATGLVSSLGSPWGLVRHYWVLIKLVLTVLATVVLLVHVEPIRHLAGVAADGPVVGAGLQPLQVQLAMDAGAALAVLLVTTALGMYKPRGVTGYGRRRPVRVADSDTDSADGRPAEVGE